MAKKSKNSIRVRFVGTNSEDVTGSCTHIQSENKQILLECGLYQSMNSLEDYKINSGKLGFKPKEIDYVFIAHNHVDHLGRIPLLAKKGFIGKIIAPKGSYDIARELLRNSAGIAVRDAESFTKLQGKPIEPLYTPDDVEDILQYWCEYEVGEKITLDEDIEFKFEYSGHILDACQIELWIRQGNTVKKIGYTSDLGNVAVDNDYVQKFTPITGCNLLIGECTYADKMRSISKKDRSKDLEKIKHVITETCIEKRGRVLIPSFANQRTQNILSHIYDIFGDDSHFNIPILVDSPLAIGITKLFEKRLDNDEEKEKFRKILAWKNLVTVEGHEESKKYLSSKEPVVCISASGFLVAGRSVNWAKKIIPTKNGHILFCGFAPQNSVAYNIKEGKKQSININGKSVANKCNVTDLKSFSSHMQHDDLLKYYSDVNCEKVALVHGEFKSKCEFAKELQQEISRKNKTGKVIVVNKDTEILL